ncbi:AAWKG family protein, partial [Streptomyces nigra]|uniref:AAWKG family protein n=1 Tax=Streptomyces nigra TaxID=1827580 RepID=UPI0036D11807
MADRYDPNSVANVDKFDGGGASADDTWAGLVTHLTGFPVPDRATIFDKLRSEHGGKLFRMDIKKHSIDSVIEGSGFLRNEGEDYDIWFFDNGGSGSLRQARIVFEGRVRDGNEIIFSDAKSNRAGNEFKDWHKDEFSTIPLHQYMNGPRAALRALLGGNTQDAQFSGLTVAGSDAVDLSTFTATGESFDYAAKFFKDQAVVLKDWEDRFSRDDASWKGEAAEVFRSLLKKIRENYDSYVETFNSTPAGTEGASGSTIYSRSLSQARMYLQDSTATLLEAWYKWASSPYFDPHRVLRYVLDDLAQWVDANNVTKVDIQSVAYENAVSYGATPQGGFSQVHPEYGDLADIGNWAKVGDKAVAIWNQGVDEYLGKPAALVQSALNNHFLDLARVFNENLPKPKSTGTASEEYAKKKADDESEEIEKQNKEAEDYFNKMKEDYDKDKKDKEEYEKELKEQQEKDHKEQEEYEKQLKEQQEKDHKEQEEYEKQLREQQEQDYKEQKEYEEELRKKQDEARAEEERRAQEQADRFEDGLDDLNNPLGGGQDLNSLLGGGGPDGKKITTESLGDLGDLNGSTNDVPDDVTNKNSDALDGLNGDGRGGTNDFDEALTQNLGAFTGLNNNPGGTRDSDTPPTTQDLGALTGLNGGGSLPNPTGGGTRTDNRKITSTFPDGSSSVFDPDTETVTVTGPDGQVTTEDLGGGNSVRNPDGSVTSLGDDGKLTTRFPDGSTQTVDPATGEAVTTDPDGKSVTTNLGNLGNLNGGLGGGGLDTPTGGGTGLTDDGGVVSEFPDGSSSVFDPDTETVTVTGPDGQVTTEDLGGGNSVRNPDGSVTS